MHLLILIKTEINIKNWHPIIIIRFSVLLRKLKTNHYIVFTHCVMKPMKGSYDFCDLQCKVIQLLWIRSGILVHFVANDLIVFNVNKRLSKKRECLVCRTWNGQKSNLIKILSSVMSWPDLYESLFQKVMSWQIDIRWDNWGRIYASRRD